jgi:Haemolysin-III related
MNPSREVLASANRHPGQISWHYDRAEIIADGVVHAAGVCLGLIGAVTLVVIAVRMERIEVTPILIYVIGLVTMLALSAAYNMWPVSSAKWILRRFDHSAIYLLIAGTYTPFLTEMKNVSSRMRRLVERHRPEARTSRPVRSPGRRSLPAAGLERCHCLRLARIGPPEREPVASRNRRRSLFSWRALACLAELALSERDLARVRAARRELLACRGHRPQLNA